MNGFYVSIISPYTEYDIMGAAEWVAVKEYSDRTDLYNGEIGELYGVRFVVTTNAKVFTGGGSGGVDVHGSLFFGASAFGSSEITGKALSTIIKPLDSGGADNALNQRGSIGLAC